MRKYLLFHFNTIYPNAGWNAFVGDFHTLEEVADEIRKLKKRYIDSAYCEYQIVDRDTRKLVQE